MIFINKILIFLRKRKYICSVVAVILIIGGIFIFNNKKTINGTITVSHTNFINQISVSGKVVASSDASLGFSQGGRISSVRVKIGDIVERGSVLASVENGDLQADLVQKEALFEQEQTDLKSLQLGTRSEQIAITESSVLSAQIAFDQAKQNVINVISDAYTKSDDAITNKIDQFFQNSLASNPSIILYINNLGLLASVNSDRASIGTMLNLWQKAILQINSSADLEKFISEAKDNLNQLKLFLAKVSLITNDREVTYNGGSSVPATWKTDTSTARLSIDTIITSVSTAVTSYKNAQSELITRQNNLKLEQAGATKEDIEVQQARIKGAQASVDNARAILQKTLIIAPFSGIITQIDAKVGEVASSNVSEIKMMSVGIFQIESYVPEVSITQIKLGDEANVTLDAYGEGILFKAQVVSIDPAETIQDGVSTYKIKLQFSQKDDRIKSGMTANVSIIVFSKPNVIVVPGGVVFDKNGKKFVQAKIKEKISDREVVLGSISSLGQVEIISGLSDGDLVILNPKIK